MIDPLSTAIILAIFSAICSAGLNITMKQAKNKLAMRTMVAWYAALYCLPMTPFVPFPSSYGVIILVMIDMVQMRKNGVKIKENRKKNKKKGMERGQQQSEKVQIQLFHFVVLLRWE